MAEAHAQKTFQFELVSPERIMESEQAVMATVPGEAGDFGVLAGHAPLLSSIRPGVVTLTLPTGEIRKIFVAGGFADVTAEQCSVLVEEAQNVGELKRADIEASLKSLADEIASADAVKATHLRHRLAIEEAKLLAAA